MTSSSNRHAIPFGPTAETVARNVLRLRKARGLTTRSLSDALREAGRFISPDAVTRMENAARPGAAHSRRVDVDDLVALAFVLNVAPSALLLPLTDSESDLIEVTGAGQVGASAAWDWMDGGRPLQATHQFVNPVSDERLMFALLSRPPIRRNRELGRS